MSDAPSDPLTSGFDTAMRGSLSFTVTPSGTGAAGVPYKITIYPGVNHAFHNDTNAVGDRYNAEQARLAWVATVEWFRKYLL